MRPDVRYHRRAERHVGHEMPVHDVDVQPVRAVGLDRVRACFAQAAEVGGEDRGCDYGFWRHLFSGLVLLLLLLDSGGVVPLFWMEFVMGRVLWCVYLSGGRE